MSTLVLIAAVVLLFGLIIKFLRNKYLKILVCAILVALLPFAFLLAKLADHPNLKPNSKITALVLGAGIRNNETPTQILKLRLDTAVEMYKKNEVKDIIVSGDNSKEYHNEPKVMKDYLVRNGIPFDVVREDFGGRRTMDSCYRTKNYFGVNEAFVITQRFHLPRSVFLCEDVKLKVYPIAAQDTGPNTVIWGYVREIPAAWSAIKDAIWFQPQVGSDGTEKEV
jgi:vancomycin permeability regulator SanA